MLYLNGDGKIRFPTAWVCKNAIKIKIKNNKYKTRDEVMRRCEQPKRIYDFLASHFSLSRFLRKEASK